MKRKLSKLSSTEITNCRVDHGDDYNLVDYSRITPILLNDSMLLFTPDTNITTTRRDDILLFTPDNNITTRLDNTTNVLCEHNINKSTCLDCSRTSYICEHNKRRKRCKDCKRDNRGGEDLCDDHYKRKEQCRDCGGSSFCEHNKIKYSCPLCSTVFCQHGRRKYRCYDHPCTGSEICNHNCRKSQCKHCGGSAICEHEKVKYECRLCKEQKRLNFEE